MTTTTTHAAADDGFDPARFLDSEHGQRFWRLCDRSLIRRAEAVAIVAEIARQVSEIKADATDVDVAAALPDAIDDDAAGYRCRQQYALKRLQRHIRRLGADPVPTEDELREQIDQDTRLGIWYDVEVLRARMLIAVHDRLTAQDMDADAVLAAGEPHGMVPRDPHQ